MRAHMHALKACCAQALASQGAHAWPLPRTDQGAPAAGAPFFADPARAHRYHARAISPHVGGLHGPDKLLAQEQALHAAGVPDGAAGCRGVCV